ncbi:MAG: hypothetical protein IKO56_09310, partial [Alphaproteobacteria bacterium]|nr:hypothetical protein [Alphaproteobacteria bacterium]
IFATSKDKKCLQASLGFRFGTLNTMKRVTNNKNIKNNEEIQIDCWCGGIVRPCGGECMERGDDAEGIGSNH